MAIYVDNMLMTAEVPNGNHVVRGKWSHLMADTDEELITFALSIGLRRGWIQYPGTWKTHFDVTQGVRAKAIKAGAIPVEMGQITRTSNDQPWSTR
jgi:hypothetical protein